MRACVRACADFMHERASTVCSHTHTQTAMCQAETDCFGEMASGTDKCTRKDPHPAAAPRGTMCASLTATAGTTGHRAAAPIIPLFLPALRLCRSPPLAPLSPLCSLLSSSSLPVLSLLSVFLSSPLFLPLSFLLPVDSLMLRFSQQTDPCTQSRRGGPGDLPITGRPPMGAEDFSASHVLRRGSEEEEEDVAADRQRHGEAL